MSFPGAPVRADPAGCRGIRTPGKVGAAHPGERVDDERRHLGQRASSPDYQERPVLESSLFPSDKNVLEEEAIQKIPTSKFAMPRTVKVVLFRLSSPQQEQAIRYYGYGYWRSEEYLKIQQAYTDTLSQEISKSDRIDEVASIPPVLTPKEPSLPMIRETAVRLQADMVMVLKLSTDVYEKYRWFQSSQAKAFCTCEGFFFDVRTGLIPFSKIITRDFLATQEKTDANFTETMPPASELIIPPSKLATTFRTPRS